MGIPAYNEAQERRNNTKERGRLHKALTEKGKSNVLA
jgi:hypothetical protein